MPFSLPSPSSIRKLPNSVVRVEIYVNGFEMGTKINLSLLKPIPNSNFLQCHMESQCMFYTSF